MVSVKEPLLGLSAEILKLGWPTVRAICHFHWWPRTCILSPCGETLHLMSQTEAGNASPFSHPQGLCLSHTPAPAWEFRVSHTRQQGLCRSSYFKVKTSILVVTQPSSWPTFFLTNKNIQFYLFHLQHGPLPLHPHPWRQKKKITISQ